MTTPSLDDLKNNFITELADFTVRVIATNEEVYKEYNYDPGTTKEEVDLDQMCAELAAQIANNGIHVLAEAVRYIEALENELYASVEPF